MQSLAYRYAHVATEATTGYFTCVPPEDLSLAQALSLLETMPCETFLHQHVLTQLRKLPEQELLTMLKDSSPVQAALAAEALLLANRPDVLSSTSYSPDTLVQASPLPLLHALKEETLLQKTSSPGQDAWKELYRSNIEEGTPLPQKLPPRPVVLPDSAKRLPVLAELYASRSHADTPWERPPASETASRALMNLMDAGILAGPEQRHEASLSPVGLLRSWNVSLEVNCPPHAYTLEGTATTWGRGLSIAAARASYAMEMVERASAYFSLDSEGIRDRSTPLPLQQACFADLPQTAAQGALNPSCLPLARPYTNEPLWWIPGQEPAGRQVLVPVQAVGLFCNLPEPELMTSPGSTGLASGNTMAEARLSALTEVFERNAEATTVRRPSRCFTLSIPEEPHLAPLAALLTDYAHRGIQLWFQDITGLDGVPCFQCCVRHPDGSTRRATGAGLSAVSALVSAMTETPYPYPHGLASLPAPANLPVRHLRDFPDYRLGSAAESLELLESLLATRGITPIYVDLTREDLEFPVVRALVPGMIPAVDTEADLPPLPWIQQALS